MERKEEETQHPGRQRRVKGHMVTKCRVQQGHEKELRDFPGILVVKTLRFHCRGHGVGCLVRELRSFMWHEMTPPQKKKSMKEAQMG